VRGFKSALAKIAEKKEADIDDIHHIVAESGGPVSSITKLSMSSAQASTNAAQQSTAISEQDGHSSAQPDDVLPVGAALRAAREIRRRTPDPVHATIPAENTSEDHDSTQEHSVEPRSLQERKLPSAWQPSADKPTPAQEETCIGEAVKTQGANNKPPKIVTSQRSREASFRTYQEVFRSYCGNGIRGMDGKGFAKLCRETGFVDNNLLSLSDADLIFAKVVTKGHRRISLQEFEEALWLIAEKKGDDYGALLSAVSQVGPPTLLGTRPEGPWLREHKRTSVAVNAS